MSTVELVLIAMIAVLLALVARLVQQNKLLRAEVLLLENLRRPIEAIDEARGNDDDQSSVEDEAPSDSDEEAKLVLKAKTACQIAEMSISDLSDDYERDRFESYLQKAESIALSISDPFYQSAALHEVVILRARAGHEQKVRQLMEQVQDHFVRGQIEEELADLRNAT